ncbi:cytochrome P450 3A25 [Nephila pilipes]|uniref:Cytochrome P450 3A25 n=1 Tax=Nephila pilipes TaxID=299642 RepID=A0A8X6QT56_NEPPI|nr:cytochrome P450 3A25 [Nephila pilipes]
MLGTELLVGPLVTPLLILVCSVLFFWYSTRNFDYWKKRNVPFVKPYPFVGSVVENMRKPLFLTELRRWKKYGRIFGHFEANRALLSVADPELLRQIFVKDFQAFPERRKNINSSHQSPSQRLETGCDSNPLPVGFSLSYPY